MNYKVYISVMLFMLLWGTHVSSQILIDTVSTVEKADVQWIDQFPQTGKKKIKKRKNLRDYISLITGARSGKDIKLIKPVAVFAQDSADIWIVDQGTEALCRITKGVPEIPKGFNQEKFNFQSLVGICSIPDKGLLFTDSKMNKIFFIKKGQKSIEVFGDSIVLNQPTGIFFSQQRSEIWVVETGSQCITILDNNGKKIRSFGIRGTGNGEFNYPTSIWIDNKGFVYVVDALNYRVQIFDQTGEYLNSFGKAGNASGFFARPKGIATDSYGNIYVVDALFHVVQIFDKQGHFLLSFGAQGREPGNFWMPSGIFIDKMDNIYIADTYNSRIQRFKLDNIKIRE